MGVLRDAIDTPAPYRSVGVLPAEERRIKMLRMSVPMLAVLLRDGASWTLVKNQLPDDARFLRWRFDGESKDLVVTVWSASFPEIPLGGAMVDLDPPYFEDARADS